MVARLCVIDPVMHLTSIQVERYAGMKAGEAPRRFTRGGGREYLLKHDLDGDEWFLGQQW
jgi:hypothetical protein